MSQFMEFWNEFKRDKSGLVGLGILILCILLVIFEPLIIPFKEAGTKWRSIEYWQDNSQSAPPIWMNLFTKTKQAASTDLRDFSKTVDAEGNTIYQFHYNYQYDLAPYDLIIRAVGSGTVPLTVSVVRPDKQVIELFTTSLQNLSENEPIRISVLNSARDSALSFVREFESEENLGNIQTMSAGVSEVIFSEAKPGFVQKQIPLKGDYIFEIKVSQPTAQEGEEVQKVHFEEPHISVVGRVSGLLGTDNSKRDIFSGIIAGLKWALLIGFFTSIISVFVGVFYGIITAYFGGKVDAGMMFFWDYFISLPVLPILIVAAAIFKPSIWTLVGVLIVFSWAGSVKTVRSIALQIKEETFVEAARALGASHGRIIFRHMAPILIPYSFASMALAVPGAIIYESTVSLLGLGDTTVVTWGQILNDAYQGQAMLTGLWWWIIPPGLAIAIIGMTFAFLGFALDRILHPKLQTR